MFARSRFGVWHRVHTRPLKPYCHRGNVTEADWSKPQSEPPSEAERLCRCCFTPSTLRALYNER